MVSTLYSDISILNLVLKDTHGTWKETQGIVHADGTSIVTQILSHVNTGFGGSLLYIEMIWELVDFLMANMAMSALVPVQPKSNVDLYGWPRICMGDQGYLWVTIEDFKYSWAIRTNSVSLKLMWVPGWEPNEIYHTWTFQPISV